MIRILGLLGVFLFCIPSYAVQLRKSCRSFAQVSWIQNRPAPGSSEENAVVAQYLEFTQAIVWKIKKTLPEHITFEELHSSALIGLLNAIRRYDGSTPFQPYAQLRIRGSIFDDLRKGDWVPRTIRSKNKKIAATQSKLEAEHQREPSDAEMAKAMNLSLHDYRELLKETLLPSYVFLDAPRTDDSDSTPHETLTDDSTEPPDTRTSKNELITVMRGILAQLPLDQRTVVELYYYSDLKLREIAAKMGFTESRASQILAAAKERLRVHILDAEQAGY